MNPPPLVINVKAVRDKDRAVTRNGLALAPLTEATVASIVEAVRLQDRDRRTRIEQSLRGLMLAADDTVDLTHSINVKIESESGRTA